MMSQRTLQLSMRRCTNSHLPTTAVDRQLTSCASNLGPPLHLQTNLQALITISNRNILSHTNASRSHNKRLRRRSRFHPRRPAPQPPRLPPPLHLPAPNNLVRLQPPPHHWCRSLWLLLHLWRRLPRRSATGLAPGVREHRCSSREHVPRGEDGVESVLCVPLYLPHHERDQAFGVGYRAPVHQSAGY